MLLAGFVVWEGIAVSHSGPQWMSISEVVRAVTRPVPGRWLLLAAWLWAGWHLFVRGWAFFLRGPGARTPPASPPSSLGAWLRQVLVPLGALSLVFLGMVVVAIRSRARTRTDRRVGLRGRRLAIHVVGILSVAYLLLLGTVGVYALVFHGASHGMPGSAARGGAFLAFAIAAPTFVLLSAIEAVVIRGRRPEDGGAAPRG